jgi:hypothetical protein
LCQRRKILPSGGRVRISTNNPTALQGIYDFLRFQIKEHKTGDSLDVGKSVDLLELILDIVLELYSKVNRFLKWDGCFGRLHRSLLDMLSGILKIRS